MKNTALPTKTLIVAQSLKPELLTKIKEAEEELKALPPVKEQKDADEVNRVLKKAKSLLKLINAERMEITRPLNEVIDIVINMEKTAISTLVAMTNIKNQNLIDFAKEQDRKAAEERERIRKEAEENANKEKARVTAIMEMIGKFEKSALKTISECTLENIDDKIKGLTNLKFSPSVYQEFIENIEALRAPLLQKLMEKKAQLKDLAELAKKDAKQAAERAEEAKAREKEALEEVDAKTAANASEAQMNVVLNEQMNAEIKESTIQGGKSVQRPWVYKGVESLMAVPYEFLTVDEKKVKEAIKSGRHSIPGLFIEQEIRNVSR